MSSPGPLMKVHCNLRHEEMGASSRFGRAKCPRGVFCLRLLSEEVIVWCRFSNLVSARGAAADAEALAAVLREGSPGIARPLWDVLPSLPVPVQFVAGGLDTKFAALASKMASRMHRTPVSENQNRTDKPLNSKGNAAELRSSIKSTGAVILEGCGHAIHTEQPEALVPVIRSFVQSVDHACHS